MAQAAAGDKGGPAAGRGLPQHPAMRLARRNLVLAGVCGVVSAGLVVVGVPLLAATTALGAGVFLWAGLVTSRSARAVLLNNVAYERLTRGEVEEAERLLAQIAPRAARKGSVARSMGTQRAMIALYRGDAEQAVDCATRALGAPYGIFGRDHQAMQDANALALRALAHASMGRDESARADAARVESMPLPTPEALSRAALAMALLVSRTEGAAGLAALFAKSGATRMIEYLSPRERVLARALRRMARAPRPHAYREPAKKEGEEAAGGELASWVAKIAPGAAAYAADAHASKAEVETRVETTAEAREAVLRLRTKAARSARWAWRTLFLWVLLVVMFLAIWQFLTPASLPAPPPGAPAPPPYAEPWYFSVAALTPVVLFVAMLSTAWKVRRLRGLTRALATMRLDVARGEDARAEQGLLQLSRSRYDAVAGNAFRGLAELSERRADFGAALAASDAGLARLSRSEAVRAVQSDLALPDIVATRALALVMLGRGAEAAAERARLAEDYPSYPFAARAHFRVALVAALRAGDLEGAAKVARTRSADLPLSLRDDLLVDVVLAVVDGAPQEELDRIAAELADDAKVRAWVDAVAPGLCERMHLRARVVGGAAADGQAEAEQAAAEAEAEAQEERQRAARSDSRRV